MKTLIQMQEGTIARMMESRSSEKREAKNRKAALRQYSLEMASRGYGVREIEQQIKDVRDMYSLRANADTTN